MSDQDLRNWTGIKGEVREDGRLICTDRPVSSGSSPWDEIADRLGELYQRVGALCPDEEIESLPELKAEWAHVLDEIVAITADVERFSGRRSRL